MYLNILDNVMSYMNYIDRKTHKKNGWKEKKEGKTRIFIYQDQESKEP